MKFHGILCFQTLGPLGLWLHWGSSCCSSWWCQHWVPGKCAMHYMHCHAIPYRSYRLGSGPPAEQSLLAAMRIGRAWDAMKHQETPRKSSKIIRKRRKSLGNPWKSWTLGTLRTLRTLEPVISERFPGTPGTPHQRRKPWPQSGISSTSSEGCLKMWWFQWKLPNFPRFLDFRKSKIARKNHE